MFQHKFRHGNSTEQLWVKAVNRFGLFCCSIFNHIKPQLRSLILSTTTAS